jgi:preprotein translocase subunit YajC
LTNETGRTLRVDFQLSPDIAWTTLMLAQDAAGQLQPPAPGEAPSHTGTAAPGSPPSGNGFSSGPPPAGAPPMGNLMFIIMAIFAVMIIMMFSRERRERKRREATINSIKKHDRVQTIGGVIGSVVEVKPDYVILKVDESSNTRITFARAAIQQVLSPSPESGPESGAQAKG